jgi:hypothetical protein
MTILSKIKSYAYEVTLFFSLKRRGYLDTLKSSLLKLKAGLAQETIETKEMLEIYQRFTLGESSKEEMTKANAQFRDLIKSMGLGVILVLPFAPITIPLIVKLGRRLGIEVLPSSFKNSDKSKD